MKDLIKKYLKFCGINSIIFITCCYKLYNRLKQDGYELNNSNKSKDDNIMDFIHLILLELTPIYNIATSAQLLLVLQNDDFYNIIKNRLHCRGFIRLKDDNINSQLYENGFDDSDIEEAYRTYTIIKRELNINNEISEPFKEILDEMKDENNKIKEKK